MLIPQVFLELTNKCTANCLTCLNRIMRRERGYMDFGLFKKCIDEIAEGRLAKKVHFYGDGEPYLCPSHMAYFRYGIEKLSPLGIRTVIITNGSVITEIPDGIADFIISFNAGRKETYERITGLDFDRTVANIYRLWREGQFQRAQNVEIHMLVFEGNKDEMGDIIGLFGELGIPIRFSFKYDNQCGKIRDETLPAYRRVEREPCHYVEHCLNITWNGQVSLCPHDFDNEVIYGDANREKLREIWFSPLRLEILRAHREGRFTGLCRDCNYNTPIKGKVIYWRHGRWERAYG